MASAIHSQDVELSGEYRAIESTQDVELSGEYTAKEVAPPMSKCCLVGNLVQSFEILSFNESQKLLFLCKI